MRTFMLVVAIVLIALFAGCGAASTTTGKTDWNEVTSAYPDSVYWKAFGEGVAGDIQFSVDIAIFNARAAIARTVGSTIVKDGEHFTVAELRDSRTVRQEVKEEGEGRYRAKVLVIAPKSLNPRQ